MIDEVHTYHSEESFPDVYDRGMALVAQFKLPVIALSGTLPEFLIAPLAVKLRLTWRVEDIDKDVIQIRNHDVIGKFPSGFTIDVKQVPNVTSSVVNEVHEFLYRRDNDSVHIFAATTADADNLAEQFKVSGTDFAVVRSGIPMDQVMEVCNRWRDGKLQILITTTCGLVGIESPSCSMLVFHGFLYNLLQIVQAFGRLRP